MDITDRVVVITGASSGIGEIDLLHIPPPSSSAPSVAPTTAQA